MKRTFCLVQIACIALSCNSWAGRPDTRLFPPPNYPPPEWRTHIPLPDSTSLFFVGTCSRTDSLETGRRKALEDAASQLVDYLGIKVSTRLISRRTEISAELVDDMRRYGTANVQGTLIREIYHEEWRPYKSRKSYFNVWVLVTYPRKAIEEERNRQRALQDMYKREVSRLISEITTASRKTGITTIHVGGFKDIATDKRYSFSRILENDIQTGLVKEGIIELGAKSRGLLTGEYKSQKDTVDINVRLVELARNASIFAFTVSIPMESLQPEWLSAEMPVEESLFSLLEKPKDLNSVETGSLEIFSNPAGAQIFLNGEHKGKTNMTLHDLPTGTVTVTLMQENYEAFNEVIQIKSGETTHVDAALNRKMGSLSLKTIPPGASVKLDGKYAGTSPLTIDSLTIEQHDIQLTLKNHKPHKQTFWIDYKKQTSLELKLIEEDGSIFVVTSPPGANVYLDDKLLGATNPSLKKDALTSGKHTLRIEKEGYGIEESEIDIHAFQVTSKAYDLRKVETGYLKILSNQAGAIVAIKGISQKYETDSYGELLLEDVEAGTYHVTVSKQGYAVREDKVKVLAGKTETLNIKLSPIRYDPEIKVKFTNTFESLLIPGIGQSDNGQKDKATYVFYGWAISGLVALSTAREADDKYEEYEQATSPAIAEALYKEAKDNDDAAVAWSWITLGIWAYAVIDAFVEENQHVWEHRKSGWLLDADTRQAKVRGMYQWVF